MGLLLGIHNDCHNTYSYVHGSSSIRRMRKPEDGAGVMASSQQGRRDQDGGGGITVHRPAARACIVRRMVLFDAGTASSCYQKIRATS